MKIFFFLLLLIGIWNLEFEISIAGDYQSAASQARRDTEREHHEKISEVLAPPPPQLYPNYWLKPGTYIVPQTTKPLPCIPDTITIIRTITDSVFVTVHDTIYSDTSNTWPDTMYAFLWTIDIPPSIHAGDLVWQSLGNYGNAIFFTRADCDSFVTGYATLRNLRNSSQAAVSPIPTSSYENKFKGIFLKRK